MPVTIAPAPLRATFFQVYVWAWSGLALHKPRNARLQDAVEIAARRREKRVGDDMRGSFLVFEKEGVGG